MQRIFDPRGRSALRRRSTVQQTLRALAQGGTTKEIDISLPPFYNSLMDSLDQQSPTVGEERDTSRLIIMIAVTVVIGVALVLAFLLREPPKTVKPPSPYIAQLKLSNFKMSA